jgi:RNA polymerase sigma-70 factor, ECF subfamily
MISIVFKEEGGIIVDRQFYNQYYDLVYKYILFTTHDEQLTHDLLQETFFKFFKQSITMISNEQAYLLRIARNLIYDHFRKKRLIQFFTLKEDTRTDDAPLPDCILIQEEISTTLYKALQQIPFKQREVIVLRYIEEFTVKETAHILKCNETRVKNDTARGLKTLRNLLEGGELDGRAKVEETTKHLSK